jgi:DNA repair exonuclease SbcCD nuclease subunit
MCSSLVPTYVLVGNHDYISNSQFLTSNHWLNGLKEWENVTIVDSVVEHKVESIKFILAPYVSNGRFEEALSTLPGDWKDANIIFAHQEFQGVKMGAFNSIDGDVWKLDYPNVVSGHIHLNQKPQENLYYPGSSLSVAFGETNKNVVALLTVENKNYSLDEIDLELPKKKIVYIDAENVDSFVPKDTEDKIKLSISGVYEDFKTFKKTKKYREIINSGIKVVFKAKKVEVAGKKESIQKSLDNNPNDFKVILKNIIDNQKNPYLTEVYELVLNSKSVSSDDILYL